MIIFNVKAISISTHALTWSATLVTSYRNTENSNFNSRAHVERDRIALKNLESLRNFNSRAHVERDIA